MDAIKRYRQRRSERLGIRHDEENCIEAYRRRRLARLAARFDADGDEDESGGVKTGGGHGNTKIPFGLCQREGIKVGKDWSPKDAWDALAGKGYSASEVYKELRQSGKVAPRQPAEKPKKLGKSSIKHDGTPEEFYKSIDSARKKIDKLEKERRPLATRILNLKSKRDLYAEYPDNKESRFWNKEFTERFMKVDQEGLQKAESEYKRMSDRYGADSDLAKDALKEVEDYKDHIARSQEQLDIIKEYEETGKLTKLESVLSRYDKEIGDAEKQVAGSDKKIEKLKKDISDGINQRFQTVEHCKDAKDVETYLNNKGYFNTPDSIRLGELSPEAAVTVGRCFDRIFERYPKLAGLTNSPYATELAPNVYAQCSIDHGQGIAFNKRWFNSPEFVDRYQQAVSAASFHPPTKDPYLSAVAHEFGHAIEGILSKDKEMGYFSKMIVGKCMDKFGIKSFSDVKDLVSGYAVHSEMEFVAEAFSEYFESDNPRPVSKFAGRLIEEELKKQGYM